MKNDSTKKSNRLMSLDALRGFDMFFITGGHYLIAALAGLTGWGLFEWMEKHMHHVEWNGFHFLDLIFPLFLFIAGVSWPFSLRARKAKGQSNTTIYKHAIQRLILLVFLGMIYNGLLRFDFETMRYASVLGRIGFGWFFAAIIVMNSSPKWWWAWFGGILLGYWAMMALIPVPGYGAGNYTMEGSLAGYIDRMLLPGRLYKEIHDPAGILSTIPSVATALMGNLTGNLLIKPDSRIPRIKKFYYMMGAAAIALILGWGWDFVFPINKNLWTSSFVLWAGGLSLVLLAIFYLIIDIWGFKRWAFFFVVIGMNAITIYMLRSGIFDFSGTTRYFFGGIIDNLGKDWGKLIYAIGYISVVWSLLYLMYRKKIFLKV